LQRLTGLEREKIEEEYKEVMEKISYFREILDKEELVLSIIKEELIEIKNKYSLIWNPSNSFIITGIPHLY
ncbi:hypothetical protein PO77_13890, partial [Vibrio parahaemolyticus]